MSALSDWTPMGATCLYKGRRETGSSVNGAVVVSAVRRVQVGS